MVGFFVIFLEMHKLNSKYKKLIFRLLALTLKWATVVLIVALILVNFTNFTAIFIISTADDSTTTLSIDDNSFNLGERHWSDFLAQVSLYLFTNRFIYPSATTSTLISFIEDRFNAPLPLSFTQAYLC